MMEDSPCLYISVYEDDEEYAEEEEEEEEEEGEMEGSDQEEVTVETDMRQSSSPELCENQDSNSDWDSFPCQHCESCFTSQQGLERHIRNHTLPCHDTDTYSNSNSPLATNIHPQEPDTHPTEVESPPSLSKQNGDRDETPKWRRDDQETEGGHACEYCEKVFNTHINKRRHERRVHRRHLPVEQADQTLLLQMSGDGVTSQQEPPPGGTAHDDGPEPAQHYMLDISSNVSENLSLYVDGKIVSTSMMSACGGVEVGTSSSALGGMGSLRLDPAQINQALSSEVATGQDTACPSLAKRRTATPPLLPQIKTELESEVIVTSSSSSLVSSLIENLLPQSKPSPAAHRERTIFLSPKLKRLLDEQDGLKPTLALITDGQKFSSPLSVSVLPVGSMRYRRRTASPAKPPESSSTSNEEEKIPDAEDSDSIDTAHTEARHVSSTHTFEGKDDAALPVEEIEASCVAEERWPPRSGGNPCNQLPLDLSNAVKRGEEEALAEAALDLSLQKQSLDDLHPVSISVPLLKKRKPNSSLLEKAMLNQYAKVTDTEEQTITLGNPEAPLVTNFTIVTGSRPGEPSSESLVYGLTLPPVSLDPLHTSLLPVALQQPSACTIALSSSAVHAVLPTAPNLITVLASIASPSNQALQVLAPNMASEPLVVCREDSLNPPGCDFNSAFGNAAGLITLSQPFDPALNLPGHVFLTDPITLNTPVVDSAAGSVVPFSPAVTLADSLLSSYNIPSNTVLIECTIALESPGNIVPATMNLQETIAEPPAAPQMIINQVMEQQQQDVSLPSPQIVDPATVVPPLTEPVTVSDTSPVAADSPTVGGSNPEPEPALMKDEELTLKEEAYIDQSAFTVETPQAKTTPRPAEAEESSGDPPSETPPSQTFTKNFVCNVCDKLFHSMKELGHHVGDHAEEWPYKCEFCVLLFDKPSALLEHRLALHGVGTTYVCSVCSKEFVYLSNLKHHQEELHPSRQCAYTQEEKGKLRPQNHNCSTKVNTVTSPASTSEDSKKPVKKEEGEASAEEPLTTVQITAPDDSEIKGPDVRLGINQHYPSFKPPPFPYHNRSPAGSMASATNFTTHNIPQSFSTAIRCTKCGKSFDNLPELHKHILACANASDKRRYTPKKNPIPLRHFAKAQNGVLSTTNATNGLNASHRPSQANNRSKQNQDLPVKIKLTALNKRKKRFVQRAASQRNKSPPASDKATPARADAEQEVFVCPHCSREFTMRRSRTKHMAVCPKKPKEVKKRKDAGVSLTKENNGHLLRGGAAVPLEEKRQSPLADQKGHGGRVYVSTPPAKRPAILPVQAVLSHKRSKIIIKESIQQQNQEESALNDLPVVRTFNPSMRQYGRAQPGAKDGVKSPLKITLVRPQVEPEEPAPVRSQGGAQTATATSNDEPGADQQSPAV